MAKFMKRYQYKKAAPFYSQLLVFLRFDEFWPDQQQPIARAAIGNAASQPKASQKIKEKKSKHVNPGDIRRSMQNERGEPSPSEKVSQAANDQKNVVNEAASENRSSGHFAVKVAKLHEKYFSQLEAQVKARIDQDLKTPLSAPEGERLAPEDDDARQEGQPGTNRGGEGAGPDVLQPSAAVSISRNSLVYIDIILDNCQAVAEDDTFVDCEVNFEDLYYYVSSTVENQWIICERQLRAAIGEGNSYLAQRYLALAETLLTCKHLTKIDGEAKRNKFERLQEEVKILLTHVDFGAENALGVCKQLEYLRPKDFTMYKNLVGKLDVYFQTVIKELEGYFQGEKWTTSAKVNAGLHLAVLDTYVEALRLHKEQKLANKLSSEVQKLRAELLDKLTITLKMIETARTAKKWQLSLDLLEYLTLVIKSKKPLLPAEHQQYWEKKVNGLNGDLADQENNLKDAWSFIQKIQLHRDVLDAKKLYASLDVLKAEAGVLDQEQAISYTGAIQLLKAILKRAGTDATEDLASGTNDTLKTTDGDEKKAASQRITVYASLSILLRNLHSLAYKSHNELVDKHGELTAAASETLKNQVVPKIAQKLDSSAKKARSLCVAKKFDQLEPIWADLRELETELKGFKAFFNEMPVQSLITELQTDIGKKFKDFKENPSVLELAMFVIEIKTDYSAISQIEVGAFADTKIRELFDKYARTMDFFVLAETLQDFPVGQDMVSNGGYPQFAAETDRRIKKLQALSGITIEHAMTLFQRNNPDVDAQTWIQLRTCYDIYEKEYNECLQKFMISGQNSQSALVSIVKRLAINVSQEKDHSKIKTEMPKLLAYMLTLWSVSSSMDAYSAKKSMEYIKQPNVIQALIIMRLLGLDSQKTNNTWVDWGKRKMGMMGAWTTTIEKHLAELETGGGKSIVLGALASLLALLNCRVNVACYSERLVQRDEKDFDGFWTLLGVRPLIQYSTLKGLANQILKEEQGDVRALTSAFLTGSRHVDTKQILDVRPRVLLIDEADVFFQKDFYGNSYDAATLIKSNEITLLFEHIWKVRNALPTMEQMKHLQVYTDIENRFPNLKPLLPLAAKSMLRDVKLFNSPKYKFTNDEKGNKLLGYLDNGVVSAAIVHGYKTAFAYLHARDEKEINAGVAANNIGLIIPCGNFSFAEVPKVFQCILGVTGTLSTMQKFEEKVLKTEFNICKSTLAPSIYPPSKFKFDGATNVICEADRTSFYATLAHAATAVQVSGRPCLIFFYSEEALNDFKDHEYGRRILSSKALKEDTYNFPHALKESMRPGNVTFLPAVLGRGIDFKCNSNEVESKGGVHVIQAFFSVDISEERQIKGRTARQSASGSYQIITCVEDLKALELTAAQITSAGNTLYQLLDRERKAYSEKLADRRRIQVQTAKKLDEESKRFLQELTLNRNPAAIIGFLQTARQVSGSSEGSYHWIFAVDISGSMGSRDIRPTGTNFGSNRLGAVCQQAWDFLVGRAAMNRYSLVAFDDRADVLFSGQQSSPELEGYFRALAPRGGTNFSKPFEAICSLLAQPHIQAFASQISGTKILFLSDGEGGNPGQVVENMMRQFPGIRIRAVKFGKDSGGDAVLQDIATRGKDEFVSVLDAATLGETLESFAAEPMELY
eukprot:gb/GEZN01000226.1/.p1 GENE.gb/GEZN01000226.1/~~gb/GEZN01000226.1/.p1  ORF type:complete len:1726 (-),score=329.91 gb/GEZN01000226.1/:319-5208(-)